MNKEQANLRANFRRACAHAKDPRVAELLGFLGLEPLVLPPTANQHQHIQWCSEDDHWLSTIHGRLRSGPLHETLPSPLPAPEQGRFLLGRRIETLARWALSNLLEAELIAHNLPIYLPIEGSKASNTEAKEKPRRTIGELDLIYRRAHESLIRHRELAAKWYIFDPNTRHPGSPCPDGFDAWWGPMRRDRLDLKLARMCDHQITLGRHPATQQTLGQLSPTHHEIWFSGQLFWPLDMPMQDAPRKVGPRINPRAICGHWARHAQWCNHPKLRAEPGQWYVLEKSTWLSRCHPRKKLIPCQIDPSQTWERPRMLALCSTSPFEGLLEEQQRLFIVPNDWGTSA